MMHATYRFTGRKKKERSKNKFDLMMHHDISYKQNFAVLNIERCNMQASEDCVNDLKF